ncbi:hypothetical protein Belba_2662 [Belliella baltica DSM 15883]|uniref:DinB-like domain-containing protein n=1 Tax=Belliella baltica (strain DSM 15883 / CIP 108006 / LMG 21964 / BA134) TaxID=866536 RepID=I3Z7I9_BELBD|nr:DinB family protein [Belliella baltica]AFL85207.1 hypothetical protein Belba_2662 [Belliella baltica DSM 15883]
MNENLIPKEGEYAPYYGKYIEKIIGQDISKLLLNQIEEVRRYFESKGEESSGTAYGPGKWTAKEVLNHIIDTDRVMTFRAMCFARGEKASFPGFDQDIYVANSDANQVPLMNLLEDFEMSRYALVSMMKTLPQESFTRFGNASGHEVSVRALFHIMAGHTLHHLTILKERY